jgi:hypothetical protein
MDELQSKLERAIERIARTERIVARQIADVAFMRESNHDRVDAVRALDSFFRTLEMLQDYERLVRTEMEEFAEIQRQLLKQ